MSKVDAAEPAGEKPNDPQTKGADEEKARLESELAEVEQDIQTLKETLNIKIRRAQEIKKRLGYTDISTLQYDLREGWHKIEDTDAYIKTAEIIGKAKDAAQDAKEKVGSTISAIKLVLPKHPVSFIPTFFRNSETVKTFTDKVGSTYTTVKDAIIHSTYGHLPDDENS
ncbi:unnamed protein product [Calicophoron daubneyi]|uniref:Tumor protein D52 n=1 Tax=Calicophoron daubneyi TaxID=300641 RepID=A0AAV2TYJ1_CALDB